MGESLIRKYSVFRVTQFFVECHRPGIILIPSNSYTISRHANRNDKRISSLSFRSAIKVGQRSRWKDDRKAPARCKQKARRDFSRRRFNWEHTQQNLCCCGFGLLPITNGWLCHVFISLYDTFWACLLAPKANAQTQAAKLFLNIFFILFLSKVRKENSDNVKNSLIRSAN